MGENVEENIDQFETLLQNDWVLRAITIVVILAVTAVVAHLLTKFLRKILMRETGLLPSSSIFVNIARASIWILGICVILTSCFGVNVSAVIAALGVGGIALSLGFQDTISNLISGLQVSIMKIIEPGDNIEVGADKGVVVDVTWRHTTMTNSLGETIIVPNSTIGKTSLVKLRPITTVSVPFVIRSAGTELDKIAQEIEARSKQAVEAVSEITKEPKVSYSAVTDFGFKGAVTLTVRSAAKAGEVSDLVVRAIAPLTQADSSRDTSA